MATEELSPAARARLGKIAKSITDLGGDLKMTPDAVCALVVELVEQGRTHGGARKGAGRPARDWLGVTKGNVSLHEMPLRLIVEKILAESREGKIIGSREAFSRVIAYYDPENEAVRNEPDLDRLFAAYQHAIQRPSPTHEDAQRHRRAVRRDLRLASQ